MTVIEGSNKSIQKIKELKLKNTYVIKGDLENLQNLNIIKKFDNIFLIHTFEHIKNGLDFGIISTII